MLINILHCRPTVQELRGVALSSRGFLDCRTHQINCFSLLLGRYYNHIWHVFVSIYCSPFNKVSQHLYIDSL